MIRHLLPRSVAPTRALRRRSRPTLDMLEGRVLLSHTVVTGDHPATLVGHRNPEVAVPRSGHATHVTDHHATSHRLATSPRPASASGTLKAGHHTSPTQALHALGMPPTSFTSDGGYVLTAWGPNASSAYALALWTVPGSSKQELVAVGTSNGSNGSYAIAAARYNTDGTYDTSFGTGGLVTKVLTKAGGAENLRGVTVEPDGTIVGTGQLYTGPQTMNMLAARLTPNGALDTSFNGSGWASVNTNQSLNSGYAVGLQSTGKVVVAGSTRHPSDPYFNSVLARYTAAGKLDSGTGGFGQTGTNGLPLGYRSTQMTSFLNDDIEALAVLPDDKILAVGRAYGTSTDNMDLTLMRFTADGNPDPTFNGGTPVLFNQGGSTTAWGRAIALQPDGKIVVAGDAGLGTNPRGFLVARFNPDGTPDTTFNNGAGSIRVDVVSGANDSARGVAIDGSGRIVVGGNWNGTSNGANVYGVAVTRLNPDGTLDSTFGTGGIKSEVIPGTTQVQVGGLVVANDGSAYLDGYVSPTSGVNSILLVHFLP